MVSLKNFKGNKVERIPVTKKIGVEIFFVMYWTPEQTNVYNDLLNLYLFVSIDATGSIVRKITSKGNY